MCDWQPSDLFAGFSWFPAFCELEDFEFQFIGFRLIWVEVFAVPVFEMLMIRMLGIGNGGEELLITREPADVLG